MFKWLGKNPVKVWRVESSHLHPDTGDKVYYSVELWGDNKLECSCLAGQFKKKCKHKEKKEVELIKEFGSINKAVEYYGLSRAFQQ